MFRFRANVEYASFAVVFVTFAEPKCYHSVPNDCVLHKTKLFRQIHILHNILQLFNVLERAASLWSELVLQSYLE